ncbi:MAG: ABC transporter ATP-binding protein [Caldilineaceae bacterium]|nr:ABC transporter ATP-binding protein [Caldilineaceae bacterium]
MTARSILQIVDPPGRIVEGNIFYHRDNGNGQREVIDLAALSPRSRQIRDIRGKDIAMIFQEPMTSLSPIHTVGDQITEVLRLHLDISERAATERAVELLTRVGIPQPADRIGNYPFQLSGGMRQRVMIAMALACNPVLLIADEPTTAVDVTTQAQILDLLQELQEEFGMAIMLITHDLGVVAEMADDVAVMYLGKVAEEGDVDSIFHDPKHPYTQALLRSIPKLGMGQRMRLDTIRGMVPAPFDHPSGCPFHTRCDEFMPGRCDKIVPTLTEMGDGRKVSCLLYE